MRVWDENERIWTCDPATYWDRHFTPLAGAHAEITAEFAVVLIVRRHSKFPDYSEEIDADV